MVSDVQRYDLVMNYRCGESIEEMEQADSGEWVRFEDVEALTAELTALRTEHDKRCHHGDNCACAIMTRHEWHEAFCKEREGMKALRAERDQLQQRLKDCMRGE